MRGPAAGIFLDSQPVKGNPIVPQYLRAIPSRGVLLLAISVLCTATRAHAQLYVFGREDKSDVVYTVDRANGRSKAVSAVQAKKTGAIWRLVVESTEPGYGAVFCVSENGGSNPRYFYSVGKATSKEAIDEAKAKALGYARSIKQLPYIMRAFKNTNRYPLETPTPQYTTMGVRG